MVCNSAAVLFDEDDEFKKPWQAASRVAPLTGEGWEVGGLKETHRRAECQLPMPLPIRAGQVSLNWAEGMVVKNHFATDTHFATVACPSNCDGLDINQNVASYKNKLVNLKVHYCERCHAIGFWFILFLMV